MEAILYPTLKYSKLQYYHTANALSEHKKQEQHIGYLITAPTYRIPEEDHAVLMSFAY